MLSHDFLLQACFAVDMKEEGKILVALVYSLVNKKRVGL